MLQSLVVIVAAIVATAPQENPPDPTFLDTIKVVESKPAEGELTFEDADGEPHTVREGDVFEGMHGTRVKEIGRTTLILTRVVAGADGQKGEALIVVRFDRSGKTKVREYRTVPDVSVKTPRPPNDL